MKPVRPIPYGRQYISNEDIDAVVKVLKSDFLTQGPAITEFERDFANYIGVKYAVAVSNATAGLHLSALALNVQPGDKILSTPITFVASTNSILYSGGEIEFVDIDPETYLIDLDKLEDTLRQAHKKTYKGIIPVDFAGYPLNMERLHTIAKKYDLWIIEDACHAPGAYFIDSKGKKQLSGNAAYSETGIFSFHPVKHIASGEGGMITTNDEKLYQKLSMLRTHGITKDPDFLIENHGGWYYEMQTLGYNYRITDFQATLGNSQLKRANTGLFRRNEIAEKYDKAFRNIKIKTPKSPDNGGFHAYHLYIIQVDDRKGLYDYLRENNVFAQVLYIPVYTMPYYKKLGFREGACPVAEEYYKHCLALPMYPTLTDEEQDWVIEKVIEYIK